MDRTVLLTMEITLKRVKLPNLNAYKTVMLPKKGLIYQKLNIYKNALKIFIIVKSEFSSLVLAYNKKIKNSKINLAPTPA